MNVAMSRPNVNLKTIALPASHGGWGFLLEPVLLGLWLAPTAASFWLGLAALGAFLSQQPLKLAWSDRRRGRRYPRSVWAERFALLYGGVAVAALILAALSAAHPFWLPLLLAMPLALVQLYYDAQNRGRDLAPELSGAGALGAVAAAAVMAAGWPTLAALAVWAILFARAGGSIVYVRARLRLARGQAVDAKPVWLANSAAVAAIAGLAMLGLAPWLAVGAMVVLFGRAIAGLSSYRRRAVPARVVGFQEMGYGLLTVILTGLGYTLYI